ncbi:TPA: hypothetical protein NJ081_003599 [Vibrio parahaemolyticus]|nr:hypothetical protein [Vibrio parahaemolyticus]
MDVVLVSIDLTETIEGGVVQRLCSAPFDVVHNGYQYTAVGDLLAIEEVKESAELASIGVGITLSGIDPAYRHEIDNAAFKKAPVEILRCELPDDAEDNIIPSQNAVVFHRGTCDTPVTKVDYTKGTMTIELQTESVFGSLVKTPDLCRTSQASHESRHPGDEFFKYVASSAQEEIWRS